MRKRKYRNNVIYQTPYVEDAAAIKKESGNPMRPNGSQRPGTFLAKPNSFMDILKHVANDVNYNEAGSDKVRYSIDVDTDRDEHKSDDLRRSLSFFDEIFDDDDAELSRYETMFTEDADVQQSFDTAVPILEEGADALKAVPVSKQAACRAAI